MIDRVPLQVAVISLICGEVLSLSFSPHSVCVHVSVCVHMCVKNAIFLHMATEEA